jgi:hypothetical protein
MIDTYFEEIRNKKKKMVGTVPRSWPSKADPQTVPRTMR